MSRSEQPSELSEEIGRTEGNDPYDNQWFSHRFRAKIEQYIDRKEDQAYHDIEYADIKPKERHLFIIIKEPFQVPDDAMPHQVNSENEGQAGPNVVQQSSLVSKYAKGMVEENASLDDKHEISHQQKDLTHGISLVPVVE